MATGRDDIEAERRRESNAASVAEIGRRNRANRTALDPPPPIDAVYDEARRVMNDEPGSRTMTADDLYRAGRITSAPVQILEVTTSGPVVPLPLPLPSTRRPYCCPVCYGTGARPAGFYGFTGSTNDVPCRACSATGLVWG